MKTRTICSVVILSASALLAAHTALRARGLQPEITVRAAASGAADEALTSMYAGMRWRQIGPFRAGRVSAVAGIAGNPAHFYIGTPGGGVWETTDSGTTWRPISDDVHTASIGAIAVAPSNPEIIYFGTGDVSEVGSSVNAGDGVYKSTDGGKTWHHVGLEETWHIGALWVDPHNPDVVIVAALGKTYTPSDQRGIFKTTDGGASWKKVLFNDDKIGAIDVAFDPSNPKIGLAALWGHYVTPANLGAVLNGTNGGAVYKTTDEGDTWQPVTGLPSGDRIGRIGVGVAAGGARMFAIVAAGGGGGGRGGAESEGGLYRSDDGGATWTKSTKDSRVTGSGYFSKVYLDPRNSDVVYVMQTSMYRSTDGGHNFISYKGAPGGDDNHVLWIDPTNSQWMIMGSDQGATISLNGGQSWSSWYNQPTAQVYHLSVDNRFPYWVYGTQQDSGSVGVLSRGDYGAITMLDWDPVGGYEFGYIVPDPANPNFVYAGGPGRAVVRIDRTSRQVRVISPNVDRNSDFRTAQNPPLAFSPQDPRALFWATQFLMETRDGGMTWTKLGDKDLTDRSAPAAPAANSAPPNPATTEAARAAARRAVTSQPPPAPSAPTAAQQEAPPNRASVNTFSLSPARAGIIWAGTTNGIVQLSIDAGKIWRIVTPPGLSENSLVSMVEASPTDAASAYVAVDMYTSNDFRPHIFRTHDSGATWKEIDTGIPDGSFVRVVREDTERKHLLYAGTENGAYVSFDDGDRWASLQLNFPTTSVRDLVVHGNDLVACTYGRAFWVLDDLTPLREVAASFAAIAESPAHLFTPQTAIRVRHNDNQDTPFPPEMPAGANPASGAIIDYYLKSTPASDVTLTIYDAQNRLVRQLTSAPEPPLNEPPPNVPMFWMGHPKPLGKEAGMNRIVWDLRYTSPEALRHNYAIAALPEDTPPDPQGPLVAPGVYKVKLSVDGKTYEQSLKVFHDPRVKVSDAEMALQTELAEKAVLMMNGAFDAHRQISELRVALADRRRSLEKVSDDPGKAALESVNALDQQATRVEGGDGGGRVGGGAAGAPRPAPTLASLNANFGSLITAVDGADGAPTEGMQKAFDDYVTDLIKLYGDWTDLRSKDLPALNAKLAAAKLSPLQAGGVAAVAGGTTQNPKPQH